MPKLKTHRGLAKRVKKTASGKIKRSRAFHSHLLSSKSAEKKEESVADRYGAFCERKEHEEVVTLSVE